jgi:hypothetical protein
VTIHIMTSETREDLGTIVYSCPICQRCVEVDRAEGSMRVLYRGDQTAQHRGGALAGIETEVQQDRPAERQLH